MKIKHLYVTVYDLIIQMRLEKDQVRGQDHEYNFQDVEGEMRHLYGDVHDLIRYMSLELIGNDWTREIN